MEKKLYRDEQRKKIGGVCAGLAEYFGVDVSIVRVVFLVTAVLHGTGAVIYCVLWAVLPKKDIFFRDPNVDYTVPPQDPFNPFKNATPPNFTMPKYDDCGTPFTGIPAKKTSNAGVIVGAALIVFGSIFLLNNFDLIPDIDFHVLWPVVLVVIGITFIFSGAKKQPWEKEEWNKTATEPVTEEKKEEPTNDNPPTV
ncbi:MAG: PspC domain-containing protein [Sphingobacteriales bacterium]|nr:MAG: PspC domain-containing protein [Sphingobacteriales bacterium]